MRVDKIEVVPVKDSINPELLFEIEFFIQRRDEIPIEISGSIFSDENKKIANIQEVIHDRDKRIELSARNNERIEEEKLVIKSLASLNHKVLDYIETLRAKNPKGDVILKLEIFVKTLNSRTNLSNLNLFDMKGSQGFPEGSKGVFYQYQPKFYTSQTNMWILSGDGSPTFIEIKNNHFIDRVTIRSSDWIHDYCPVFQIG